MKLNFKEYIQKKKFLDIFCYVFCAFYLFFVVCLAANETQLKANIQKEINNMLLQASIVNKKIEENNFYNKSESQDIISKEPLFTDGKTAIIKAYNDTIYANSFYGEAIGTMNLNTAGMTVKVSTYTQVIRYGPTEFYDLRNSKLLETNADMFSGMINELSNRGVKTYKLNEQIKHMQTPKTYLENNIPKANFSGCSIVTNIKPPIIAESLYIINEDTIKEITYFKIKYKKGFPSEYYVQAKLDPYKATLNYKNIIKVGANVSEDPIFKEVTVTMIINAEGHVTSVNAIDKCTIKKVGIDCPCTLTQTYTISGVGEKITYFDEDFR